jgi:hypothetical protein
MVGKFFSTLMRYLTLTLIVCAILASCGNPFGLPAAFLTNAVDSSVTLYALSGTPVNQPSGYLIYGGNKVRTDLSSQLDFAFDFDTAGRAVLLPTAALKLTAGSGFQISPLDFDSIKIAPVNGYNDSTGFVVTENSVVLAQSSRGNALSCTFNVSAPLYAKLQVLAIDDSARSINFKILRDSNCGYRGLEPGLPRH